MTLTRNQWFLILGTVLSAIVTSTAYFTNMFGPDVAKQIVGTAGFLNMILNGIGVAFSGQGQNVRDVLAMPGVEKLTVNSQANSTLATIAIDPLQNKISPTVAAMDTVTATAKAS
jgi:hypothetical protein